MKNTQKLTVNPVFVKNKNVRNFESMMSGLDAAAGEGRFGLVWGRAGRGKTRTAQWYVANTTNCIYILTLLVWQYSKKGFLEKLCFELGNRNPKGTIGQLFGDAVDRLMVSRPAIFVDEPEKLSGYHLGVLRDLTEATAAPIILIGEEGLPEQMRRERRVMSRTYQEVEFKPFALADVVHYVTAAAGVRFAASEAAALMTKSSGGDIRIVRRDTINLVKVLNAKGTAEATVADVQAAIKFALTDTED